ncbi:MAG: alpha/beta hydrolase [Treponema sp.]|nr:alpha/beta hydrolase [Treponema sp.]
MDIHNDRKGAIKKLKLLAYNGKIEVETFRQKIDEAYRSVFLPNGVECSEYKYGNIDCDILSPEIYSSNRVMLYIHGGSYVGGSRLAYRNFCSSIASKTFSRVVVPEYRLAPASPFPSANEDIQNVFKSLFTEEQIACSLHSSRDSAPLMPELIIAADGSAASIACALIFNLRERYRKCIKKVILFSPWLDLSPNSRLLSPKKISDEVMSGEVLRKSSQIYTYESNTANPYVSPLRAALHLLENFPEVYIQMGKKEILLDDAIEFSEKLQKASCKCTLDVWDNMMFMFQMAHEYLPESHKALDKIGKIVTQENDTVFERVENQPKLESSLRSEA